MVSTTMMKWGMSVDEGMWKTRVGRFFSQSVGVSLCSTMLFNMASASSAFGVEEMYRYISPNGTVNVTNVPSDRRFSPLPNKRTYHASIPDQELEDAVAQYAEKYRLSPALVMAVIKAESDFNPIVISRAGAVGLMQLIPETAIQHGVRNLYDTRDNIAGGARHLRYLLDRYHGNVRLALAAYNAGERKVDRYRQIPPFKETRAYVKKVMGFYRDYRMSLLKTAVRFDKNPTFVP
jgi:soluble lytic murein transglycosylase-like protein